MQAAAKTAATTAMQAAAAAVAPRRRRSTVVRTSLGCVWDMFGSSKGRTELSISGSGPKNYAERHGNVRFCVAPQKLIKNHEKLIF